MKRALVFVALLALFVGCRPQAGSGAGSAPLGAGLQAGASAPAWTLKDLDGKEISSAQFAGKVVVLDFWATWCPPCVAEIPHFVELQKKYGPQGVVIVGVSLDTIPPAEVKAFAQSHGINYTLVMADEAIQQAYGPLDAIPTTFLVDRSGVIRDRKLGLVPAATYEKRVAALLK